MPSHWSFAELAIEAMYQTTHQAAFKAGMIITREEWWNTPGGLLVTPEGYAQLMRAGVTSIAFTQQFRAPAKRQFLDRNGAN